MPAMKTKRLPPLTQRQLSILLYIATYQDAYGYAPTQAEVAAGHGVSVHSMARWLDDLQALGYLSETPNKRRSLKLTGKELP